MMNDNAKNLEKNQTAETAGTPIDDKVPEAPKKKRRWVKRLLLIFAVLLVAVLLVVAFCLGPIVRYAVNNYGAEFLGVDKCEIGELSIYPFVGHVKFEKLLIGKPIAEGTNFSHRLLSVEFADADVDVFSLWKQKKVFEHLEIRNVVVNYEQLMNGKNNVGVLLDKVLPPKSEDDKAEVIFIGAHYLAIENVNVSVYMHGMSVAFPSLSANFKDGIGLDEDLTPVQFGMKLGGNFANLIDFFQKTGVGTAAGAMMNAVSDAANATYDFTSGFVSDAATLTGDAVSGAASITGDAAKATTNIVGDAVDFTGDAAKATADAVGGIAEAFFGIFKSEDEEKSDK